MEKKESKKVGRGKKLAAVTLGAAAAAVAGIAVAKLRSGGGKVLLHVRPSDDGWELAGAAGEHGAARFGTKRQAVAAGRTLARELSPAELVIHRRDGSEQRRHRYPS